jgi:twitching motility two-component system response regulator PilH
MKTILIVEDTHAERQMSSALLTHAGFQVAVTESAETAWTWLNANPKPNLILLDIVMPGESGLDLCRKIREHDDWKEIPIVLKQKNLTVFGQYVRVEMNILPNLMSPKIWWIKSRSLPTKR